MRDGHQLAQAEHRAGKETLLYSRRKISMTRCKADTAPVGFGEGEGRVRAGTQLSLLFTGRIEPPSGGNSLLQVTMWGPKRTQLPVWAPQVPSRTKMNLGLSGSQLVPKLVS